ncbi:hypothetical protein [Streptomyces cathayae]|uniref:Regulatory protein n=1 Tax=Streptomyces cathayae TaxID=3031124 RepID=A0ABY8KB60_9ACTN|nr:hypothetical protein [Streptomyces sp. HUAS 5]WGD44744.1 hypothetical protein PYS65_34050 [Streptomyces sp. HUAS 5]WGD45213.1 hypothetical protein PYS65_34570 [Streptomyces sp. HUAS 5]
MPKTQAPTTELASQYRAQVTGDLERNVQEQERIGAEITALQERLTALRQDHTVLVSVQQALGLTTAPAKPAAGPDSAALPSPRKAAAAEPGKRTARKPAAKKAAAKASGTAKTARPTLVDLIRHHLAEQSEPRSAAEISAALGQAHPERGIKTKVVRVTLEGLVAKSQAQRTKQGTSVFYTAPAAPEPTTAAQAEKRPADADR